MRLHNKYFKQQKQKKIGHWIALIINTEEIIILDPAGKYAVQEKHLKNYILKNGQPLTTNFISIQPKNSWYCGVYVLLFLHHKLVLKKSFQSNINMYKNKINPDKKVCENFKKYFKLKCKNVVKKIE